MAKITVKNTDVTVIKVGNTDYISLTDIANWIRNRNNIEYLGIWESLYNPNFKPIEFDRFKKEAGLNAFTLSPQRWRRLLKSVPNTNKEKGTESEFRASKGPILDR